MDLLDDEVLFVRDPLSRADRIHVGLIKDKALRDKLILEVLTERKERESKT